MVRYVSVKDDLDNRTYNGSFPVTFVRSSKLCNDILGHSYETDLIPFEKDLKFPENIEMKMS